MGSSRIRIPRRFKQVLYTLDQACFSSDTCHLIAYLATQHLSFPRREYGTSQRSLAVKPSSHATRSEWWQASFSSPAPMLTISSFTPRKQQQTNQTKHLFHSCQGHCLLLGRRQEGGLNIYIYIYIHTYICTYICIWMYVSLSLSI